MGLDIFLSYLILGQMIRERKFCYFTDSIEIKRKTVFENMMTDVEKPLLKTNIDFFIFLYIF